MRGRVLALQAIVFLGSTPIGGPIIGYVCQHWGARYGLVIGALATIGAAAYGLATVRTAKALEISDAVAAEALADASTVTGEGPVIALP